MLAVLWLKPAANVFPVELSVKGTAQVLTPAADNASDTSASTAALAPLPRVAVNLARNNEERFDGPDDPRREFTREDGEGLREGCHGSMRKTVQSMLAEQRVLGGGQWVAALLHRSMESRPPFSAYISTIIHLDAAGLPTVSIAVHISAQVWESDRSLRECRKGQKMREVLGKERDWLFRFCQARLALPNSPLSSDLPGLSHTRKGSKLEDGSLIQLFEGTGPVGALHIDCIRI
ncbi:hypothetical protein CALCODRAFT_489570 [Calocera cornea HHB12733]|uniref:Uncharacterized protein n=1 Tax=Calocera cornea HHB12733 TaxID=1353952 RepID=A0A165K2N0_9BASI|nr:hypothetical protein CALCODRAFT_489570 [Calocera cornea HHB12733]